MRDYMYLHTQRKCIKREVLLGLPGDPVVKTSPSNTGSVGSIPGRGANIPHASVKKPKQKTETIL